MTVTIFLLVIDMKLGSLQTQSQVVKFLGTQGSARQSISDSQVRGLQLERLRAGLGKWRIRALSTDGRERICMTLVMRLVSACPMRV